MQYTPTRQIARRAESGKITRTELIAIGNDCMQQGIQYTVETMTAVMAIVLRDKIGLSKPKTIKAIREFNEYFDSVLAGYVTIEEIKEAAREEIGLEIQGGIMIRRDEKSVGEER